MKKVNIDASIQENNTSFKISMVLRDDRGYYIAGMMKCIEGVASVLEAEAIGVYEACRWFEDLELRHTVIECDSINVVNAVSKRMAYYNKGGHTIESCRHVLRSHPDL